MQNRYSNTNYDRNNQSRNEYRNDQRPEEYRTDSFGNDESYRTRRDNENRGYDDSSNYSGNMDNFGRSRDTETRSNFGFGSQNFSDLNDSNRSGPRNYSSHSTGSSRSTYGGIMDTDSNRESGLFSGKGPKGYKRSDARIHEDACDALTHDAYVDASEIEIKVEGAVVTLTGTVQDRRMKRKAEECVEHCRGVEDVQNNLKVKDANLWEKVTGQEAKDTKKSPTAGRLQ